MQVLPKVTTKLAHITPTITLYDGTPASASGMDVAIIPPGTTPTALTTWVAALWDGTKGVVLLIGPAATVASPPSYHLNIPATGGDLWARILDNPETDAALIDHIELE